MAENSGIAWTDHTFNPWIGCTKVSPACENCYAETLMDTRYKRVKWGAGQPRVRTSTANWGKPYTWDRKAAEAGVRTKVFCASLADVFDNEVPDQWRNDLFSVIQRTPNLDWLLLTKRPAAARRWFDIDHNIHWKNVWLGTTVENAEAAGARIGWLTMTGNVAKRFLSVEPLLEPLDLYEAALRIDWVIVGGESGANARTFDPKWARQIRDDCRAQATPFFMKQMSGRTKAELEAIPPDLMIREFPK